MTDNNSKKNKSPLSDLVPLLIGEIIVIALVVGGFVLVDVLDIYKTELYKVPLGAVLGAAVILGNHLWLSLTVDREIKKYLELRGSREMSDEEAESFTKQHSASIQKAIATSTVTRTLIMFVTLILAFITGWFNPLAAAIPMFTLRPILTVAELIKSKKNPKPDPQKFVKYDWDEEEKKKKEDE